MEGGCTCGNIRYRLNGRPLIVHACHCTWCQRETGTAHALNAVYEAERVDPSQGRARADRYALSQRQGPAHRALSGLQGRGVEQLSATQGQPCASCASAPWMIPAQCPPDIHIFTSSKQPWVTFGPKERVVAEFYDLADVWSDEARERRRIMRERAGQA